MTKIAAFVQLGIFRTAQKNGTLRDLNPIYLNMEAYNNYILQTRSGAILRRTFKELYYNIVWRQAHPGVPENPKQNPDYDTPYIRGFIDAYAPDIIIALGVSAQIGVNESTAFIPHDAHVIYGPHPQDKTEDIKECYKELKDYLNLKNKLLNKTK